MKKHFLIFIFTFLFLLFKAQDKFNFPHFDPLQSKNISKLSFAQYPVRLPCLYSSTTIYITAHAPQLPFFCNMEEKFRSKFSFFLKLRAGNDEAYERMIHNK